MSDPAMVRSGFEKVPNQAYFTIDKRCVQHLDRVFPLHGIPFKEPCAGQGHLIEALEECGATLELASDLYSYPNADERIKTGINVLTQPPKGPGTIITNPPYDRAYDVIDVMLHNAPGAWVIVLLRSSQAHVQGIRRLMGFRFYGLAPLPFRPKWFNTDLGSPRHDFSWFLWRPTHLYRDQEPRLML